MACRPIIPQGKIPPPTEAGDWDALLRWTRWINDAHGVLQQGVIETVDGDCQFLDVNPLRAQSVGQTSIIRASVPPDQRGASPCPYVKGALVIFAPVLGGTDQGHTSAIMEPSAETPFLVTTTCCVNLVPKTLTVNATITSGAPSGDCADISEQEMEYVVANDRWEGPSPILAERNSGFAYNLACSGGIWTLNTVATEESSTCEPFEVTTSWNGADCPGTVYEITVSAS